MKPRHILGALAAAALLVSCASRAPLASPSSTDPTDGPPSPGATPEVSSASPAPNGQPALASPAVASPSARSDSSPSAALPVVLEPGSWARSIVPGLRVRSQPRVADDSVMYEPTLPKGSEFSVMDGPVAASGYWWYQVDLRAGVLRGNTTRGWVAAGDHDGTPWIAAGTARWPAVSRGGITLTAEVEESAEPIGRLRVNVTARGLDPNDAVSLTGNDDVWITWVCGREPEPCGDAGCAHAYSRTIVAKGYVPALGVAGADGVARVEVDFVAPLPDETCPQGSTWPWLPRAESWQILIADDARELVLVTPEAIGRGRTE